MYALESLTALNNTEATERAAPLSVFSALSGISGSFIRALACPEAGGLYALESLTALNGTDLEAEAAATERGAPLSVFSAVSGISGSIIRTLACPEAGVLIIRRGRKWCARWFSGWRI